MSDSDRGVMQLYPPPARRVRLQGLYLDSDQSPDQGGGCVYTNFIASMDGRIAVESSSVRGNVVPGAISNARDWRLYQELGAHADAVLVSGRLLRERSAAALREMLPVGGGLEFVDLRQYRREQGISSQPALVFVTASVALPLEELHKLTNRAVYVATGNRADAAKLAEIERCGATVLRAGEEEGVDGETLVQALEAEGFRNIYSVAGPGVLATLLRGGVLNRIYLTQVHRMIGGETFDTLLEGEALSPPADFRLKALYYDDSGDPEARQFFGVYETSPGRWVV